MRLFHTPTSPFVRKVMVVAHETGLASRIETTFLRPMPMKTDPILSKENPLSKIPTLVTPEGPLYDSRVICEHLDGLHDGAKLIAPSGPARFRMLRLQALCDGILDAAILVFYERTTRPKELQWSEWIDGQTAKATQGLDALDAESKTFESQIDLAQICAGVTIGWLEFRQERLPFGDVLASRPNLARFYAAFRERPSMKATVPVA
jgi:glutathione S-transferase